MNPYLRFVAEHVRLAEEGRALPLGGVDPPAVPARSGSAPKVLLFSPHPDDECIIGALPLRLLREAKMNVMNVAVTQGSKKERQPERLQELRTACHYMGYGLIQTRPGGLENVNLKHREMDRASWRTAVKIIADILARHQPRIIFFPHEHDWNSTHIGTHWLVLDALADSRPACDCYIVETEFWGPMANPNLMVESSPADVADLVTGTSFHVGEVRRNPFHILLPAWLQDNVRRGSELIGGQGEAAPAFGFATLYRQRIWFQGRIETAFTGGKKISCTDPVDLLFQSLGLEA